MGPIPLTGLSGLNGLAGGGGGGGGFGGGGGGGAINPAGEMVKVENSQSFMASRGWTNWWLVGMVAAPVSTALWNGSVINLTLLSLVLQLLRR